MESNEKNINLEDINPEVNDYVEDNNEFDINNNTISNKNTINKLEVSDFNKKNDIITEDNDLRVINYSGKPEKFKIPSALKKTFIMTTVLFSVGAILIGLGFIDAIWSDVPGLSISMWTLGGITFIPGGYYGYLFYKAYRAKSDEERDEILEQIPEM